MARPMMKDKGIPLKFWAEAVSLAVYIQNRCPTVAVSEKTPIEAWSGVKPDISHLRVFGSVCYAHIPKEKRQKLDDKSERCILLGFSEGTKGYRLYNLEQKKIIASRDVIFDEAAVYDWAGKEVSSNQQNVINMPLNWSIPGNSNTTTVIEPETNSGQSNEPGTSSRDNSTVREANSDVAVDEHVINQLSPTELVSSDTQQQPLLHAQRQVTQELAQGTGMQFDIHDEQIPDDNLVVPDSEEEDSDSPTPPRGSRTLIDIYARSEECNLSIVEPSSFEQAQHHEHWREAMKQEMKMIEKNST
jgi:hypothetical protein